ncbi:hypothetical protein JCM11641_005674 [Rhodosporidiobolus odoratus]
MPPSYSILLFGATGFTGRLVLHYLLSEAPKQRFTLAIAGRNKDKLRKRLNEVGGDEQEVGVFEADATDEEGLRRAVKESGCKVVISLVGPYLKHGKPLLEVVAEEGLHYCDLTGEAPFVYHSIKQHSSSVLQNKSIVLHAAGFDSVPSDLCAFLAVEKLKQLGGPSTRAGKVRSAFIGRGGISGGTVASMLGIFEAAGQERKAGMDPFALSPVRGLRSGYLPLILGRSTYLNRTTYGSFWPMGPFNSQIVRRSWGLLQASSNPTATAQAYGPEFDYDEHVKMPNAVIGVLGSLALYFGILSIILLPPVRWLLRRYAPHAGEGPSEESMKKGWFEVETVAKSEDGKWESRVRMRGEGDPGYSSTTLLLSSCALSLLLDLPSSSSKIPSLASCQGGHLTPATALGHALVDRLEGTGKFRFEVEGGEVGRSVGKEALAQNESITTTSTPSPPPGHWEPPLLDLVPTALPPLPPIDVPALEQLARMYKSSNLITNGIKSDDHIAVAEQWPSRVAVQCLSPLLPAPSSSKRPSISANQKTAANAFEAYLGAVMESTPGDMPEQAVIGLIDKLVSPTMFPPLAELIEELSQPVEVVIGENKHKRRKLETALPLHDPPNGGEIDKRVGSTTATSGTHAWTVAFISGQQWTSSLIRNGEVVAVGTAPKVMQARDAALL